MIEYIVNNDEIMFKLNEDIYPTQVILKTAYNFTDICYILLDKEEHYIVKLLPKDMNNFNPAKIVGDFFNELLNQLLRKCIFSETQTVRQLILARALYTSYIQSDELSNIDEKNNKEYFIDEIAKNWFEGVNNV